MDCFTLENLTFSYESAAENALDGVTLSFREGSFTVICGESGSGKSTLLRCLKTSLLPKGSLSGKVLFRGVPISQTDARTQAAKIGFVSQSPEAQTVTDTVGRELAFGLECVGVSPDTIRRRVASTATFFGLNEIFYRRTSELSGGQKQLLALAAVTALSPEVIILDEPTSQLDPLAAFSFTEMLARLNRETGVTVIIAEQRLENVLPFATDVAVLDRGRVVCSAPPAEIAACLKKNGSVMTAAMPAPVRVFSALSGEGECPVSVAGGRAFLKKYMSERRGKAENAKRRSPQQHAFAEREKVFESAASDASSVNPHGMHTRQKTRGEIAVSADRCYFRYGKNDADIIKNFSFTLYRGEFFALLGGNGSGKTTALKLLGGIKKPYSGRVNANGRIGVLPQEPRMLFSKDTVREEILHALTVKRVSTAAEKSAERNASAFFADENDVSDTCRTSFDSNTHIEKIAEMCKISHLLDRDPFDLSGGETLRAALAVVLAQSPDILLLDEPTNGTDAAFKSYLAKLLSELLSRGVSVFAVSHDVEFCAEHADRCGLFFDGAIISDGTPTEFFSDGSLYATAAARMSHGIIKNAVTVEDILTALSFGNGRNGGIQNQHDDKTNVCCDCGGRVCENDASAAFSAELRRPSEDDRQAETQGKSNVHGLPLTEMHRGKTEVGGSAERRKKTLCKNRLTPLRLISGVLFTAAAAAMLVVICAKINIFSPFPSLQNLTPTLKSLIKYSLLTVSLFGAVLSFGSKAKKAGEAECAETELSLRPRKNAPLPRRTAFACAGALLLIPVTVMFGVFFLKNKNSGIVSAAVLTECLLPFFIAFEGKKPKAAELAVLASLCAAGAAGRAAFFVLPQFKPVMALAVVAGVSLGAESGFLVGAVTMLVSNIMFSQGPWTPWQMFSMGIIGFLAGLLADRGLLPRRRAPLAVFGGVCAVVIYGGIMNPASVLMYSPQALNAKTLLASYASGFALDIVHALATAFFLFVSAEPLIKMLTRIKNKYL